MTKKNEPPFIPKGFITLAEAIQRVGKHRHPDTWTGVESYHHEATEDWEEEQRVRDEIFSHLAAECTNAFGPDWWMDLKPESDAIDPKDTLGHLINEWSKGEKINCSQENIDRLWHCLTEAESSGNADALGKTALAIRMAELSRKHRREATAALMYKLAAREASGEPLPNPWPTGYATDDGELPRLAPDHFHQIAVYEMDSLRKFQEKRARWLDAVAWLQQECEAGDIEAIIVEDGIRKEIPASVWALNTRAMRSMLFVEGIAEFKVSDGFSRAYEWRGHALINAGDLDQALTIRSDGGEAARPNSIEPLADVAGAAVSGSPRPAMSADPLPAKRPGGRKPHKLRDECVAELVRIADQDGLDGYTLADLEKLIATFCRREFDEEPSESTVREWLKLYTKRTTLKGNG